MTLPLALRRARRPAVVVLASVLWIAGTACGDPVEPTNPPLDTPGPSDPAEEVIFFWRDVDVYRIRPDGLGERRLTSPSTSDRSPAASYDGSKVFFVSRDRTVDGNQIRVMDADGSNNVALNEQAGVSYSQLTPVPGSDRILYVAGTRDESEIYSMTSDGSDVVRLTMNDVADGGPTPSPDGQHIYFSRSGVDGAFGVWRMGIDGSEQVHVTPMLEKAGAPHVSPDGSSIIFGAEADGNVDIFVMNVDGSGLKNLTNSPQSESLMHWSPDGSHIVFHRADGLIPRVYAMQSNGSNVTLISEELVNTANPAWSPDGTRLAFTGMRSGEAADIYLARRDGTELTRVTNSGGARSFPMSRNAWR